MRKEIEWIVTAVALPAFLLWLGSAVWTGCNRGNPAFVEVYENILRSVSGVKK